MTDKLFICTDDSIGDMICAMAAVQYMARGCKHFYLWTAMPLVQLLMQPENVLSFQALPPRSLLDVHRMDIGRAINECKWSMHPVLAYLAQQGIALTPEELPKPTLTHEILRFYQHEAKGIPVYDVLIAPWAAHGRERSWTQEGVHSLLAELPGLKVGILGAASDAPITGADNIYGQYFGIVACMIRNCKVLVTVDSSMGRLAYASLDDGRKHLLLRGLSESDAWVYYPGLTIQHSIGRSNWDVNKIVEFIESRLAVTV